MTSSVHVDNKKKDILILGIGRTQWLEHTLTTQKMYSINFTVTKKKLCLSLHYNGANSYWCWWHSRHSQIFNEKNGIV